MNDSPMIGGQLAELADAATVAGQAPFHGGMNGQLADHPFDLHRLLHALQAMRIGDFSARLPSDLTGLEGKIADTFNEIVAANERMASELSHVGQVVGREGKTRTRVRFGLQTGAWAAKSFSGRSARACQTAHTGWRPLRVRSRYF